jgi:hypothetical protein
MYEGIKEEKNEETSEMKEKMCKLHVNNLMSSFF